MENTPKLYKVLVATTVGGLSYEAGQTYELTDEQVAAFAEGEIEAVDAPKSADAPETPEAPAPKTPETPTPSEDSAEGDAPAPSTEGAEVPPAAEVPAEPAKPWAGNHTVGRE